MRWTRWTRRTGACCLCSLIFSSSLRRATPARPSTSWYVACECFFPLLLGGIPLLPGGASHGPRAAHVQGTSKLPLDLLVSERKDVLQEHQALLSRALSWVFLWTMRQRHSKVRPSGGGPGAVSTFCLAPCPPCAADCAAALASRPVGRGCCGAASGRLRCSAAHS